MTNSPDLCLQVCGRCSALVNVSGSTCKKFCEMNGLVCTAAWDDLVEETCSYDVVTNKLQPSLADACSYEWTNTSDAICECITDPVCTVAAKHACIAAHRTVCSPGSTECGPCEIGYIPQGNVCMLAPGKGGDAAASNNVNEHEYRIEYLQVTASAGDVNDYVYRIGLLVVMAGVGLCGF